MQVTIAIVHYGNLKVLLDCLQSIYQIHSKLIKEVIVVDNDEKKVIKNKLLLSFPRVRYISTLGNVGYGAGVNIGVETISSEFIFVLNADTKIFPDTVGNLVSVFKKKQKDGNCCTRACE